MGFNLESDTIQNRHASAMAYGESSHSLSGNNQMQDYADMTSGGRTSKRYWTDEEVSLFFPIFKSISNLAKWLATNIKGASLSATRYFKPEYIADK